MKFLPDELSRAALASFGAFVAVAGYITAFGAYKLGSSATSKARLLHCLRHPRGSVASASEVGLEQAASAGEVQSYWDLWEPREATLD